MSINVKVYAQVTCSELNSEQKNKIAQSEIIASELSVPSKAWPQVTTYSKITTSAAEAMSVFSDFSEHKNFFPDLLESKIISGPVEATWQVSYKMKLQWPLSDENYTVQDQIIILKPDQSALRMNWKSTKTTQVREISGFISFEKVNDYTCMTYSNLVDPGKTPGLSILKSLTVAKTKEAVKAFTGHLNLMSNSEHKERMKELVSSLKETLKNKGAP